MRSRISSLDGTLFANTLMSAMTVWYLCHAECSLTYHSAFSDELRPTLVKVSLAYHSHLRRVPYVPDTGTPLWPQGTLT
jgi:hypothetical protein